MSIFIAISVSIFIFVITISNIFISIYLYIYISLSIYIELLCQEISIILGTNWVRNLANSVVYRLIWDVWRNESLLLANFTCTPHRLHIEYFIRNTLIEGKNCTTILHLLAPHTASSSPNSSPPYNGPSPWWIKIKIMHFWLRVLCSFVWMFGQV
jgi:hypothetical protein